MLNFYRINNFELRAFSVSDEAVTLSFLSEILPIMIQPQT